MNAIPVIVAGLRRNSRKASLPWIRIAAGAMASLPFLFASGTSNYLQASEFGQAYFEAFVVVAAILSALGGQMATANSIGREAREGTLGLLFLTSLSRWDIVLGRIAAGSVVLVSILLAALPAAAVVWMLGGVFGVDWLRGMIGLLNLIFVSMAAGMVATAFVREAIPSFLAGFGILLAVGLLPFVMEFTLDTHHAALAQHLRHMSPLSLLEPTPNPTSNWAGYAVNFATSHALGWLMVFIAGMGVERTRRQLANPIQRLPFRIFQRRPHRILDDQPAQALVRHALRGLPLNWLGPIATAVWMAVVVRISFIPGLDEDLRIFYPIIGCLIVQLVWRTACAWQLTQFFHQGRQSGLFELVLTTPAAATGLLDEARREVGARWIPAALLMHLVEIVVLAAIGYMANAIGLVILMCFLDLLQLASLPVIAQAEGLRRRSAAMALAGVVLQGVVIPVLLAPFCFLGVFAQLLFFGLAGWALHQPISELLLGLPSRHTSPFGMFRPLPPVRPS